MRIYNSDGSEPEMCGNGIRCLARFVAEKDNAGPRQYKVSTGAGQSCMQTCTLYSLDFPRTQQCSVCPTVDQIATCSAVLSAQNLLAPAVCTHCCAGLIQPDLLEDGQVCVDMGEPILDTDRIPTLLPATQVSYSCLFRCISFENACSLVVALPFAPA